MYLVKAVIIKLASISCHLITNVCISIDRTQGLATRIVTNTDVMDNPRYSARKLDPDLPFSIAVKTLSTYCFTLFRTTDDEVQLATTQDLTAVSMCTSSCCLHV